MHRLRTAGSITIQLIFYPFKHSNGRLRRFGSAPGRSVAWTGSGDHADFGDGEILLDGITAICLDPGQNNQVLVAAETSRQRPFDLPPILGVDVVFNNDDELEKVDLTYRQQHRTFALAERRSTHANDRVQPAHTALSDEHAAN